MDRHQLHALQMTLSSEDQTDNEFIDDLDETIGYRHPITSSSNHNQQQQQQQRQKKLTPDWLDGPKDMSILPQVIKSAYSESHDEADLAIKHMLAIMEMAEFVECHLDLFDAAIAAIEKRVPSVMKKENGQPDWERIMQQMKEDDDAIYSENHDKNEMSYNQLAIIFDSFPFLFETCAIYEQLNRYEETFQMMVVLGLYKDFRVRRQCIAVVTILLERNLLSTGFLKTCIVPAIFDVYRSGMESMHSNDLRMETVQVLCQMLTYDHLRGGDEDGGAKWIFENVVPGYSLMLKDSAMHVRKNAIQIFGYLGNMFGEKFTEVFIVPHLVALSHDLNWAVRKAACEVYVKVAECASASVKTSCLAVEFVRLLSDPNKWVSFVAFQQLGPFVALFADTSVTGLELRGGEVFFSALKKVELEKDQEDRKVSSETEEKEKKRVEKNGKYAVLPEETYLPSEWDLVDTTVSSSASASASKHQQQLPIMTTPTSAAPSKPSTPSPEASGRRQRGKRMMDTVLSGINTMFGPIPGKSRLDQAAATSSSTSSGSLSLQGAVSLLDRLSQRSSSSTASTTSPQQQQPQREAEKDPSSGGGIAAKCNSTDDLSKLGLEEEDDDNDVGQQQRQQKSPRSTNTGKRVAQIAWSKLDMRQRVFLRRLGALPPTQASHQSPTKTSATPSAEGGGSSPIKKRIVAAALAAVTSSPPASKKKRHHSHHHLHHHFKFAQPKLFKELAATMAEKQQQKEKEKRKERREQQEEEKCSTTSEKETGQAGEEDDEGAWRDSVDDEEEEDQEDQDDLMNRTIDGGGVSPDDPQPQRSEGSEGSQGSEEEEESNYVSYWSADCMLDLTEEELAPFGTSSLSTSPTSINYLENRLDVMKLTTTSASTSAGAATSTFKNLGDDSLGILDHLDSICGSVGSGGGGGGAQWSDESSSSLPEDREDQEAAAAAADESLLLATNDFGHVPRALIRSYMSVFSPACSTGIFATSDTSLCAEVFRHCAYNFPAVCYTLGRDAWPRLMRSVFKQLAINEQERVRQSVACSMHEIAKIVGVENTDADLLPIFHELRADESPNVRAGILANLYEFVKCLSREKREEFIGELPQFFPIGAQPGSNASAATSPGSAGGTVAPAAATAAGIGQNGDWRARHQLIQQLLLLSNLYDASHLDLAISGIALTLADDRVAEVRREAVALVALVLATMAKEEAAEIERRRRIMGPPPQVEKKCRTEIFAADIVGSFARTRKWTRRQTFCLICERLLTTQKHLPFEQFEYFFMKPLQALAEDRVPNIRLAACSVLAKVIEQTEQDQEAHESSRRILMERVAGDVDADVVRLASRTLQMEEEDEVKHQQKRVARMRQREQAFFNDVTPLATPMQATLATAEEDNLEVVDMEIDEEEVEEDQKDQDVPMDPAPAPAAATSSEA